MRLIHARREGSRASRWRHLLAPVFALLITLFATGFAMADDTSSGALGSCVEYPPNLAPLQNTPSRQMMAKRRQHLEYQQHRNPELLSDECDYQKAKRNRQRYSTCSHWVITHVAIATIHYDALKANPTNQYATREYVESVIDRQWHAESLPAEKQLSAEIVSMAYGGMAAEAISEVMFCKCLTFPIRQVVPETMAAFYPDHCPTP